jgi:hypothetical protein
MVKIMCDDEGISAENYLKMVQSLLEDVMSSPENLETTIEFLDPGEEDLELIGGELVNYEPVEVVESDDVPELISVEPELC